MKTHNDLTFVLVISISMAFTTGAIGKEKSIKPILPRPKDYSNVIPNLAGGVDRELDLDGSEKGREKVQNQPKNSDLPPIEISKEPSQFQSGAIYPPGEEMVFTGDPSFLVSSEPIAEDTGLEAQSNGERVGPTEGKMRPKEESHENK